MGKIYFFTGGARSGKSKFAEDFINENYKKKIYFATSIPFDDEMKERVKKHLKRRDETWKTIEGYKNLVSLVKNNIKEEEVILFDCITNMVTNFMIMGRDVDWDKISQVEVDEIEREVLEEMQNFLFFIRESNLDCVFVTNEIGMGLIPSYPLGRFFRDICGNVNQLVAKVSDEAYMAVSGLKLKIK